MQSNLTSWRILTILADGLGNNKAVLPSYVPYHFQHLYHSCILWFKITTPIIQTDIGEGPNTRGGKGASTSDSKSKKTSPIHEPNTKTQDTTDTGSCSVRKFGAKCVQPKTKKQVQYVSVNNATQRCVKEVWILQKGLYEGTETCQKGLYLCVFAPLSQYEEKIRTTAWRHL